ncbi:MAG: 4-hydroxyphenylacetate 3-monooxygenase, oxygenase component, partial [Chloroflexi bacterium]|nr:4-hydroxyphenylacetate 3-monooxygenase, oxygenase component [Chloroflexota bacterium]MCI0829128.1 4-hydroxyphenylacetate 3-monooxygenase, oxygenase component [Chloroflexota bacterium]MCI0863183.1 4-hydroxyphenylacetate 3-monooxygenase, oxygenase component [Chloroflexota bacterium]
MPARTGKQYIEGLRERPPSLYMNGKKVKDATKQPGLKGGIRTLARLYDLQHD